MPVGIHRHPVVFVRYDDAVYAIKELPARFATTEYEVLTTLEDRTQRSARPAGIVERVWLDPHSEQSAAVITTFVEHAFPYRHLIAGTSFGARRDHMVDAVAGLMVELHLAGCYWGDCSLSNVLCRWSAGAIEAIMIDAETSMLQTTLSRGQREEDLMIMVENISGEMSDIAAANNKSVDDADLDLGDDIQSKYVQLWNELNQQLVIRPDEGYKVRERIARLNALGFAVGEVSFEPTAEGDKVSLRIEVGGRMFHTERLREITGVSATENQARYILNDLNTFSPALDATTTGKSVAAMRWRLGSFEPCIEWINDNWPGSDPIQGFCDFLLFRRGLASEHGSDVANEEALVTWSDAGFPGFPPSVQ